MAAQAVIYNPLIKKGFQEIADISSIESALNELQNQVSAIQSNITALQTAAQNLQNKKVTKCFNADDLTKLADGEIFTWHGATTSDPAELTQGYFYKKTALPAEQQVLILYHNYAYIGGQYLADTYYYSHSEDPNKEQYNATRNTDNKTVTWIGSSSIDVGAIVTISNGESDQTFVTIVDRQIVDLKFIYTDSNGDTWSLNNNITGHTITYNYYTNKQGVTINANWNEFAFNMGFICVNDNKEYLVKWTQYGTTGAKFDTVINPEGSATYTQTNTQLPTPGITEENGTLKVSFPVEFADDVTVKGTQTVVHTEEIESENDYIELRADNPLGLANGERSGLEVNNYDGNGTDCILAVDNQGWARVGDKNGTLQKLATIEETPTAGAFMKYNATDKELESTTDGSGLSVTFTPDTSIRGVNILSGDTLSQMAVKINAFFYSLKAFYLFIADYTRHLAIIDVTDWYVNNTQANYDYYIVGNCNFLRSTGLVGASSSLNITAVINWNRVYVLKYSKNNGYSVNVISYDNRYYLALSRIHDSAASLFFNGVFNHILSNPLQLKDSDVTIIYAGTEY